MHSEDYPKEPEGNFVPGIYNYCDRWCERCIYTDKCRLFATENIIKEDIAKKKEQEQSIERNKSFWNRIHKIIEEVEDLYDEPVVKEDDVTIPIFGKSEEDEEAEEAMNEYEAFRNKAAQHPLTKAASKYSTEAYQWFKQREETLKQHYNQTTKEFRVTYQGISDKEVLQKLAAAVEIILWYEFQLSIKIRRAFTSLNQEEAEPEFFEGIQKDSEGSARVALIGINRSISAWSYLLHHLETEKESIRLMIKTLMLLKMKMEQTFPGAMNFKWPPE